MAAAKKALPRPKKAVPPINEDIDANELVDVLVNDLGLGVHVQLACERIINGRLKAAQQTGSQ